MAVKNQPTPEPAPDLGKCLICSDPIVWKDATDNHCRQGHIVAIDATAENPLPAADLKRLTEEKAAEAANTAE